MPTPIKPGQYRLTIAGQSVAVKIIGELAAMPGWWTCMAAGKPPVLILKETGIGELTPDPMTP